MHTTYTVRENPLLLIHGAFIADALMPLVREPTVDEKYRLILYHRRGYGKSSHPKTLTSIAEQAADCTNLLDHLDIPHAHILGHSLGACIALQLALEDTDVVHTLALLEPALIVGSSGPASRESLEQGWQRFRNEDPEKLVDEFLEARYGKGYRTALDQVLPGHSNRPLPMPRRCSNRTPLHCWHGGSGKPKPRVYGSRCLSSMAARASHSGHASGRPSS